MGDGSVHTFGKRMSLRSVSERIRERMTLIVRAMFTQFQHQCDESSGCVSFIIHQSSLLYKHNARLYFVQQMVHLKTIEDIST